MIAQSARPSKATAAAAESTLTADEYSVVSVHDYSCVAEGQPFVCSSWLDGDLVRALRSDVRSLLDASQPSQVQLSLTRQARTIHGL